MNRKSDKVEEPTEPYVTKQVSATPPAPKGDDSKVKRADDAEFEKAMNKVFDARAELFQKLAE